VHKLSGITDFIRGHYGKVATKASSDRVTDASAKAAVHLQAKGNPFGASILAGFDLRFNRRVSE
tara:strand:- start:184 stop:375 length:192 start_codon:yes stop_codon:yes gene_type:complete